ncbi:YeiH family protein [Mangrovihabitans endophyticus]|nr:putative sulfate exporter family transporter [Mangrovihabitans endophyticus]
MIVLAPADRRTAPGPVAGLVVAVLLGLGATAAGAAVPVIGAPVFAVLTGVALSPLLRRRAALWHPGLDFAKGRVLQFSVVLLGAQLSLGEAVSVGVDSLPVMLGTLAVCLALAAVLGRRLGIGRDLSTLIGVGTGICGASAIAAVTPTIRARSTDVAYAISTIFLCNIAAVLLFPPLGHALGLGQEAFGLFAGTAVNDTSSVVAAASTYGPTAAQHAVVVKLVRTLMIIPIVLALAATVRHRDGAAPAEARPARWRAAVALVPWFLVGFVLVAALNSAGLIPAAAHPPAHRAALVCIAVALAAIGLSTDVAGLRRAGPRPLLLGVMLWVAVSATSLGLQALTL